MVGVAQLSNPSGWSSPIVRSCWLDCERSITNDLYLPVIYFKIRRKVGTNKFNLVVVDGRQVFPWFSSRNVQEVCSSPRPLRSFMTNNHIFVTRTLRPGCEVASDVSRVLCCVICASHFYQCDFLSRHFYQCDSLSRHGTSTYMGPRARRSLFGSQVHRNLPPISSWYGFFGITMFQRTILERRCLISCLPVANLIVPWTVLALARCTPFGLALLGAVQGDNLPPTSPTAIVMMLFRDFCGLK